MFGHCRFAVPALVFALAPLLGGNALAGDVAGSKDHPLLTRMPGFEIAEYEVADFDRHDFTDSKGNDLAVEGRKTVIRYELKPGAKEMAPLQITRNFVNAIKKAGGSAYEYTEGTAFLSLAKDGGETWVEVNATGESYLLTIVEKAALKQEVTANALFEALNRDGHVALYIHFDTGKATIKPESEATIVQVAEMLAANPGLAIAVEGHTDDAGSPASNRTLSEQRARAVADALVTRGIDAKRLSTAGFGQEKPIADNTTNAGRAANRRVELVKK